MRLRSTVTGYEYDAVLTTACPASADGRPVLMDLRTTWVVGKLAFRATGEIVEVTDAEREALQRAGYLHP